MCESAGEKRNENNREWNKINSAHRHYTTHIYGRSSVCVHIRRWTKTSYSLGWVILLCFSGFIYTFRILIFLFVFQYISSCLLCLFLVCLVTILSSRAHTRPLVRMLANLLFFRVFFFLSCHFGVMLSLHTYTPQPYMKFTKLFFLYSHIYFMFWLLFISEKMWYGRVVILAEKKWWSDSNGRQRHKINKERRSQAKWHRRWRRDSKNFSVNTAAYGATWKKITFTSKYTRQGECLPCVHFHTH